MSGRARVTLIAAIAALTAWVSETSAQNFPARPVTLIVPWPAGGTTDIALRALAKATEKHLGQSIVTENRPGAGGTLAPMQMAAAAKPDGYTLAQIPLSVMRVALLKKATFDPATDLSYVIALTGYTFGVVVRSDAPWTTFEALLAHSKAHPGMVRYASAGSGTTPHLTMERIARQRAIDWIHVPFKGSAETTNALLGGHVDAVADGTSWGPMVNAGKFRLLITWGVHRTVNWPKVPTLREIGVDLVANAPYGLAGPKGMSADSVKVLHDAFRKGMEEETYLSALHELDQEPFYLNSRQYREFVIGQIAAEDKLLREIGIKSE
jgi:tripartite-type tricarboxylate transporter receptor subunit TctC